MIFLSGQIILIPVMQDNGGGKIIKVEKQWQKTHLT
jgi:hypothetical protein